jgi:FAD/FMN-containing dehydrogenase
MENVASPETLVQRLAEIAGPENVLTDDHTRAAYSVDGLTPGAVVFPASTEQVAQVIRAANELRTPLIPRGSGSKQGIGPCLAAADIVLCLKQMNQVTELDAHNFTAQVMTGLVNGELQRQLAGNRLFFPLDPADMETATIGGEIATNANGPLRLMYGTVRDLVLGVTVVTPTGDIVHTGGKTMKNVAGIDLCKLFIGSWGTLGVITEAVLRLFPLPEVSKSLMMTFATPADAFRLVAQLLNSPLTPSAIELVDRVAGRHLDDSYLTPAEGEVLLIIGVEGSAEAVARHEKDIGALAEANQVRQTTVLEGEAVAQAWQTYRGLHQAMLKTATLQGKASVPIGKLADMYHAVKQVGTRYGAQIGIKAHGASGILYSYADAGDEDLVAITDDLKQAAAGLAGFFLPEAAPLWLRQKVDIMPRRNDYALMKRLKAEFDPNQILNPGRVVGGS